MPTTVTIPLTLSFSGFSGDDCLSNDLESHFEELLNGVPPTKVQVHFSAGGLMPLPIDAALSFAKASSALKPIKPLLETSSTIDASQVEVTEAPTADTASTGEEPTTTEDMSPTTKDMSPSPAAAAAKDMSPSPLNICEVRQPVVAESLSCEAESCSTGEVTPSAAATATTAAAAAGEGRKEKRVGLLVRSFTDEKGVRHSTSRELTDAEVDKVIESGTRVSQHVQQELAQAQQNLQKALADLPGFFKGFKWFF